MNRRSVTLTTVVLLALAASARAQTVDEILARNLTALGGPAALERVHTLRQTSRLVLPGSDAKVVVYGKRPNLLRQELVVGPHMTVQAYDGTQAWTVNGLVGTSEPTALSEPDAETLRYQASFGGFLPAARARGDSIQLVGVETMRGRRVIHLRVSAADHHRETQCYLDAESFLEVWLSGDSAAGRFEQELSDYKTIEGIVIPFSIRTTINGRSVGEMVVSKVELNVDLDDKLFSPPVPLARP